MKKSITILILVILITSIPVAMAQPPPAANLDQVRNGPMGSPISPGNWVNGNLNPSQSHYIEGYSVPYRVIMTNLPTDGTVITLTIGYDIKHSDKHALDYLTHYDRIDTPAHTVVFGHSAEAIDPLIGVSGVSGTTTTWAIPAPSSTGSPVAGQPTDSFNDLPAGERVITLFGGTISNVAYNVEGDLTAAKSETRVDITFTVDSTTAVLAWGGHIASRDDWGFDGGDPMSAGGIPGSPYHMRLIDWNLNNLGNQDRSLQVEYGPDFVIPESPLGTIGTLLMFLIAIGVFAYKKQLPLFIK